MNQINKFPEEVNKELKTYVYRLIDPRNGETFYVGKGKGNRVFDHLSCAIKNISENDKDEDEITLKMQRIREINKLGLTPIHIIHRHGLSDEIALEVEAALIDAYPGLTNLKNGNNSEFGSMTSQEILDKYQAETADFKNYKILIIKINRSASSNMSTYDATRFAWVINKERAEKADYIVAVEKGIIIDVFVAKKWHKARRNYFPEFLSESTNYPNKRHGFIGDKAEEEIRKLFLRKRLPEDYTKKGASNPIQYNYDK